MTRFDDLADAVLAGGVATADDALDVLRATDDELLALVAAAARLRRKHFGNTVKVNYLVNLKSGLCPEDCHYCSQRARLAGRHPQVHVAEGRRGGRAGEPPGCAAAPPASAWSPAAAARPTATSSGSPTWSARSRPEHPDVEVCACLGLLKDGQAERLREAGVDAYNHNINTAESHHDDIVTTHTYADRVDTVDQAKDGRALAVLRPHRRPRRDRRAARRGARSRCASSAPTRSPSTS